MKRTTAASRRAEAAARTQAWIDTAAAMALPAGASANVARYVVGARLGEPIGGEQWLSTCFGPYRLRYLTGVDVGDVWAVCGEGGLDERRFCIDYTTALYPTSAAATASRA